MIFENIDKYLDNLDLHTRLLNTEKLLKETQQENQRLTTENVKLGTQVQTRNILRKRREEWTRKVVVTNQNIEARSRNFIESLDGSAAKDMIEKWMNDFNNAPEYFKNWVNSQKHTYLYRVIDNPNIWPIEFRNRVEAALKKSQSSN